MNTDLQNLAEVEFTDKISEKDNNKKKKRMLLIVFVVLVLIIIVGVLFVFVKSKGTERGERPGNIPQMGNMGEGISSASGLTSVAMAEESWELDFLETALYVEENYLVIGDKVEEKSPVFKVSEETLTDGRKELQDVLTEAQLAYRQGVIDYEASVIEADTTKQISQLSSNYAQTEYDEAVAKAKENVDTISEQIEEAQELVEEYQKSVNENYYRQYYKVDELYDTYYEHYTLLMSYHERWNIEQLEDTYGSSISSITSGSSSAAGEMNDLQGGGTDMNGGAGVSGGIGNMKGGAGTTSEEAQQLSVYKTLEEIVEADAEAWKQALENYETARALAEASLPKAISDLASLEAQLSKAQTEYEKSLISYKADYDTTLAESENAVAVYDTDVQSEEEALEALKDTMTQAQENLDLFEETIGDGYFYTKKAGTIVMNAVRENSYLSGESMVLAYSDPETVTITANVSQSDIASIEIGDGVFIVISEYGNYRGTVTSINPVTQAQSRSSVTYQVTVMIEGDVSGLESNLTAYTYFGMSEEMIKQQLSGQMQMQSGGVER